VWFTLRACELDVSEFRQLSLVPLVAFLFVIDAGYLLMFTAAVGQTLGKMAAGIRVIGTDDDGEDVEGRLPVGQAMLRELLTVPSVLALGAGFLPALVGQGRAVHDRLAHTRVIRA
jgi:uncharacterized RDD family membrane protein YckC